MDVDGRRALVREPDGIHLNARGAAVAADAVDRGAPARLRGQVNWVYRCVTFRDPFVQVTSES